MIDEELLAHAERYLGPVRAENAEPGQGYEIRLHDRTDMVTAVTSGVRSQPMLSPLPLELACSARPGQEREAAGLLRRFADVTVRSGAEVEYDDGLLTETPMIPGTSVLGLLAAPHPYADEMFNLFRDKAGELRLQFVTLVPVTEAEAEYLADHETTELFDLWRSEGTELLDLWRASAV